MFRNGRNEGLKVFFVFFLLMKLMEIQMKRMKWLVCKIKEVFYVCYIDLFIYVFVSLCFVFGFILKLEV